VTYFPYPDQDYTGLTGILNTVYNVYAAPQLSEGVMLRHASYVERKGAVACRYLFQPKLSGRKQDNNRMVEMYALVNVARRSCWARCHDASYPASRIA
jgi:hypothetical protein